MDRAGGRYLPSCPGGRPVDQLTPSFTAERRLAPVMEQRPSPDLVIFGRLLTLAGADLVQAVSEEIDDNPALVAVEARTCARCGLQRGGAHYCGARGRQATGTPEGVAPAREEPTAQLLAVVADQLQPDERPILAYVVADLDRRGFLDRDPACVAAELGVSRGKVAGVIERARRVVGSAFAARDVRDCLRLQLDAWTAVPG